MTDRTTIVAPSILASDFSRLGEEVARITQAGADWIHCDVMDGHFVDNISFGSAFVEAAARHTDRHIDVHLMIERPDHYFPRYTAVASSITVHLEAKHDVKSTLAAIRDAGCSSGLAVSPATTLEGVVPHLGEFDTLLIMTVNPGFGGQPFLPAMLDKVRQAEGLRQQHGLNFNIQVDGGINPETSLASRQAGANILVAGTSVFKASDAAAEILALRGQ